MKLSVPTQLNFVAPIEGIKPQVTYSGTNKGQSYVMRDVDINNARAHDDRFKLNEHGFEVAEHHLRNPNFDDEAWIENSLYPSIESVVKKPVAHRMCLFLIIQFAAVLLIACASQHSMYM